MFFKFSGFSLCEIVIHCNKRHIFLCFLLFLLTTTDRNEAIIVELKVICFDCRLLYQFFRGFLSLDFLQLRKMMSALAFYFMIAATNA